MSLDWQNARWADGRKVAAWLDERCVPNQWGSRIGRAVCRWRNGVAADFYTLDSVLAPMGFHASDLPDDVWLEKKPGPPPQPRPKPRRSMPQRGNRLTAAQVLEIRRLSRLGESRQVIAGRFGVSPRTVSHVANGWTWAHVKEPAA